MRIMARAGLRCSEALDLKPRDVVLPRHEIRVNEGKGGKDRVIWIDETTVEFLQRWKDVRPRGGEFFFTTLKGRRLSTGHVREMVARRGQKAGIAIRVHPHLLRHTFASMALEDGVTVVELQALLGHTRLETTSLYVHLANERLRTLLVSRPG